LKNELENLRKAPLAKHQVTVSDLGMSEDNIERNIKDLTRVINKMELEQKKKDMDKAAREEYQTLQKGNVYNERPRLPQATNHATAHHAGTHARTAADANHHSNGEAHQNLDNRDGDRSFPDRMSFKTVDNRRVYSA
jgi:hypothetical protein